MNFLTILTTVLCGWTVWVAADYYIEFRAPTGSFTSTGQRVMAAYLYECQGIPTGTPANSAAHSWCTPVTSYDDKIKIHLTCNFYNVRRPHLVGHVIHLSDRETMPSMFWNLGYLNNAIDHPSFAEPAPENMGYFGLRAQQMVLNFGFAPHVINNLVLYLSLTNVLSVSGSPNIANPRFSAFVTVIERIREEYGNANQMTNADAAAQLRTDLGVAMRVALEKMIDPCSILRTSEFQATASQYCATYCNFLNIVAAHFGPTSHRCSSLTGGHCAEFVCTCSRIASPLAGCDISPMQLCNNSMRTILNL